MLRTTVTLTKRISSKNRFLKCISVRNVSAVTMADATESTKEWSTADPFESLPGPKPLPVIGNLFRFFPGGEFYNKPLSELYSILRSRYGDIFNFGGLPGRQDKVMIFDPALIQKVYRTEGQHPTRYAIESLAHYRTKFRSENYPKAKGLLVSQGEQWQFMRSKVNQPMMQPRVVNKYVKPVDEISQEFIDKIIKLRNEENEMPENFWKHLNSWALELAGRIALDTRLGCLEDVLKPDAEKFIHNIHVMFDFFYKLDIVPSLWTIMPTPNYYKMMKTFDYISDACYKYINQAIERLEESKDIKSEDDFSVLEKLIKIDREVAFVMVIEMLMAGVDTISSAVSTLLYCLAVNQEKQDILRRELARIIPNKHSTITEDILQRMPYLRACLKESLRLIPVFPGNLRVSQKDLVLGGYQIPKGTSIFMGHMTLSQSGDEFPDSDKFIPERWLIGKKTSIVSGCPVDHSSGNTVPSAKDAHPFTYMPFGFGPRMCIGRRFAELETEVLVAKLIRNYRIEWNHGDFKLNSKLIHTPASPLKYKITEC